MKKIICDTNFYYNPDFQLLDKHIVGTYLNGLELLSTQKYDDEYSFTYLKKAVSNFFTIPKEYEIYSPYEFMLNDNMKIKKVSNKIRKEWKNLTDVLNLINQTVSLNELKDLSPFKEFSNREQNRREHIKTFFDKNFTNFSEKYNKDQLKNLLQEEETITQEFKSIFNFWIRYILSERYGLLISNDSINWSNKSFMINMLITYHQVILSGKERVNKTVNTDINDINDMWMLSYITDDFEFFTNDKFWLRRIKEIEK